MPRKTIKDPEPSIVETVPSVPPIETDLSSDAVVRRYRLLRGKRRNLDRPTFEKLCAVQCEIRDILGFVGTTQEKLERWCRLEYRQPLSQMMDWIRADGVVQLREAIFNEIKSPSILSQIYNRIIPQVSQEDTAQLQAVQNLMDAIIGIPETAVKAAFDDEKPSPEGAEPTKSLPL